MHTPWRKARRLLSVAPDFNPLFCCVTNMSRCAKYHTPGERRKCRCRVLSHSSQSKNARKTPWPPWDPRTPISDKLISFKDAESPGSGHMGVIGALVSIPLTTHLSLSIRVSMFEHVDWWLGPPQETKSKIPRELPKKQPVAINNITRWEKKISRVA